MKKNMLNSLFIKNMSLQQHDIQVETFSKKSVPITNKWKPILSDAVFILILTLVSIFSVNQYQYGTFDHVISVPFLKKIIDGSLYPNDFLLNELPYLYTFFWIGLGWLIRIFQWDMPVLFFIIYFVTLFATFSSLFSIAKILFPDRNVAMLALVFIMFSVKVIGGTSTLDSQMITRSAVLPILIYSFYYYLKKNYIASFVLQGICFLLHPLSTVYVTGILGFISLINIKKIGLKKLSLSIFLFLLIASPLMIWKVLYPAPSLHVFHSDLAWLNLLMLRSAHHVYPFEWGATHWITTILFFIGFFISWRTKPIRVYHDFIVQATIAVLLMFLAGTVFTEFFPVSIIVQFQLFRSFPFLFYFMVIYFAHFLLNEKNVYIKVIGALFFTSIYLTSIWKFAAVSSIVFFIIAIQSLSFNFIKNYKTGMYGVLALIAIFGIIKRNEFKLENNQNKDWLNVQKWANSNTVQEAIFIVPPDLSGFRVSSERGIYGDWKDGTQMFFNPSFGNEWIRRMKMLGYSREVPLKKSFENLDQGAVNNIAAELNGDGQPVFFITYKDSSYDFPKVYSNENFVVYRVE